MLKIPLSIYEEIQQHSIKDLPIEACGYLAGKDEQIAYSIAMTNIDKSSEHFSFEPQEQFDAFKKAQKDGLRLIGVYHSHPSTPARPSQEDIKLAYDSSISYVIISLKEKEPVVKSFKIKDNNVTNEIIEVINE